MRAGAAPRSAPVLVPTAALVVALFLAGCSQGPEKDGEGRYVVHLTGTNTFDPSRLAIDLGETVLWRVDGGFHDVTPEFGDWGSDKQEAQGGLGRKMQPGDTYQHTFEEVGEHVVACILHHGEGMFMTVDVRGP